MGRHRHRKAGGLPHGPGHHGGRQNRPPVIREGHGPGPLQGGDIRCLLPLQPPGNGRTDVHPGVGRAAFLPDISNRLRRIHRGGRVGHTQQAGHAARRRCPAAGKNILLVGLAGIAQVNVHIHQPRRGHQPRRVDPPAAAGRNDRRRHAGNAPVLDQNLKRRVGMRGRVDHPGPGNQNCHASYSFRKSCPYYTHSPPPVQP